MTIYRGYDQATLDGQYDNRAMVPAFADHVAAWRSGSEAARAALECRRDLAYGAHERERLDLYPAGPGAPLHLFIHGGYWRAMDKADFGFLAPPFVARGVSFAALGYPLAPAVRVGAVVDSVRRALGWLFDRAGALGIDPDRIVVSGHSAGGHLAAAMRSDPGLGPRLAGIVAISGLYDLEPIRLCYLNADLHLDAAEVRRISPLGLAPPGGGPATLAVGAKESDEYHRQQAVYADHLRAAGVAVTALDLPGHDHFSILQALSEAGQPLFEAVLGLARAGD